MSNPARKAQIEALRQHGRIARDAGGGRPLSTLAQHERRGWDERDAELAQAKQNDREIIVTDAISEVDDRETQEALYAIFEYVKEKLGS